MVCGVADKRGSPCLTPPGQANPDQATPRPSTPRPSPRLAAPFHAVSTASPHRRGRGIFWLSDERARLRTVPDALSRLRWRHVATRAELARPCPRERVHGRRRARSRSAPSSLRRLLPPPRAEHAADRHRRVRAPRRARVVEQATRRRCGVTEARRALILLLGRTKGVLIAARCRVSHSQVTRWATGQQRPGTFAASVLQRDYGIETAQWRSPEGVTLSRAR
jgi:hypothetical protein